MSLIFKSIFEFTSHKIIFVIIMTSIILTSFKVKQRSNNVNIKNANEKTYIELYFLSPNRSYPIRFICGQLYGGKLPKDSERFYIKVSDKNYTNKFLKLFKNLKSTEKQIDFNA